MRIANEFIDSGKVCAGTIRRIAFCAAVVLGLIGATPNRAQSQQDALGRAISLASAADSTPKTGATPGVASALEYEVASIKVSKTASGNGFFRIGLRYSDDGMSVENYPLMLLLQQAYGVGKDRISGAPDWLNSERYDIEAKVGDAAAEELKKLSPADLRATRQHMLQALLADRFKLALHRETKELAVYNLVIAKGGSKLQESKPDDSAAKGDKSPDGGAKGKSSGPLAPLSIVSGGGPGGGKSVTLGVGGGANVSFGGASGLRTSQGRGATIDSIVTTLAVAAGRPVLDKTGLTGKYDYRLEYAPQDNQVDADSNGPSIFTAVQEQLGLKLESAKGPVEIFVIDHVEKPSGN